MAAYRACAALIILMFLLTWGIKYRDRLDPRLSAVPNLNDTALHIATVERLRAGEPYYVVFGEELRTRGYPAASAANWRTPLHYHFVAAMGLERAGHLLTALAFLGIALGAAALWSRFRRGAIVAAVLLLGSMLPALLNQPGVVAYPENWAGILIALSLAAYHLRWWTAGALFGVAAVFLRELAGPYGLVCGVLALIHKRRTESALWLLGGLSYILYYALHVSAVSAAIQPGDYAWPHSWLRWLGWPFVLQTAWVSGWTIILPYAATPIVAVLSLAGTAACSMPAQLRVSLLVYVAFLSAVGQEFNFYWGFVTAPLWTYALMYSPEGTLLLLKATGALREAKEYGSSRARPSETLTIHPER